MIAFEAVTIGVAVAGTTAALVSYLRGPGPLEELGRYGASWFAHPGDLPLSERPSEDERDAPLPKRPLRGRPE
ncbi:MAG: hypothetical protein ACR2JH_01895 [Solirubrobacteraceae bacterium]